jgi:hypothetical protein
MAAVAATAQSVLYTVFGSAPTKGTACAQAAKSDAFDAAVAV